MFGGHCLYARGTPFALVLNDTLYFCVDDQTRPRYQAMGSSCFTYETARKRVALARYYQVPGELIEDAEPLLELAREAVAAARRTPARGKRAKPART
ncbi:DNA transformation protein [Solimonas aquatica]|uniref:DNA transformation protein n=1 Tax=Solimonas aquatica TaxID=489703 RepID=A0A1H9KVM4_9GAMM|nr:TfoX/Sxy family protein [Solimonas aquatica]SER03234.1 DNA transformation protein [Solimonas aquatica]